VVTRKGANILVIPRLTWCLELNDLLLFVVDEKEKLKRTKFPLKDRGNKKAD